MPFSIWLVLLAGAPHTSSAAPVLAQLEPVWVNPLPLPQRTQLSGCFEASCVATADGLRVCRCQTKEDDDTNLVLLLDRDHERARVVVDEYMQDTTAFEVFDVDLDGDGTNELVVFSFFTAQMGMNVPNHHVVTFRRVPGLAPAQVVDVQEYRGSSFLRRRGDKHVLLAVTQWDIYAADGHAYFLADLARFEHGLWQWDSTLPRLRRKLTFGFEEERGGEDAVNRRAPIQWLFSPKTESAPR